MVKDVLQTNFTKLLIYGSQKPFSFVCSLLMGIAVKIWMVNFYKPISKCYLCSVAMETLRQLSRVAVVTAEECVFCCNIRDKPL